MRSRRVPTEIGANGGACHNGAKTFGIDDCPLCHR